MKQNINKQSTTILSMLLFGIGLLISFNIFAQAAVTHAVGDTLSDGSIVFWVDETGQHGLTAWPSDEAGDDWYKANESTDGHGPGWRLPTKFELNLLFLQKAVVGGFGDVSLYWSSTESSITGAWAQDFSSGLQGILNKNDVPRGRAVRDF